MTEDTKSSFAFFIWTSPIDERKKQTNIRLSIARFHWKREKKLSNIRTTQWSSLVQVVFLILRELSEA